jgi:CubicO group peptidase (beta-lactamase class C family)
MAAAVAQDGKIVWQGAFGFAHEEKKLPVTTDTIFHLASLTKPFASVVLMQLVQEGKLSLEMPLKEFVPSIPDSNGVVLVKHVLTHTSEGILGTSFKYNGARFKYLDAVILKITGKPAARAIYERVLGPLGLTNTAPNPADEVDCRLAERDPGAIKSRLAQGYDSTGKRPIDYPPRFTSSAGMVSTVGDLVKFSDALDKDALLKAETKESMFTAAMSTEGKPLPYAKGWFVYEKEGTKYIWHHGWWDGNSSLIIKIPSRNQTFVLLANSDMLSRPYNLGVDSNLFNSKFAEAFVEEINGR